MLADFFESSFRIRELCDSPDGRLRWKGWKT
jgi:hypothetical protein